MREVFFERVSEGNSTVAPVISAAMASIHSWKLVGLSPKPAAAAAAAPIAIMIGLADRTRLTDRS
ncbi:hypothetical protein GCM10010170_060430 [Dactylosporangium salmoneum]|uniref:Uncharacterized protein n=1 Tax=Dactylosporangium salmoneum TaxID=53361 RepID=A0ABP5TWM5_9ACTN